MPKIREPRVIHVTGIIKISAVPRNSRETKGPNAITIREEVAEVRLEGTGSKVVKFKSSPIC